MCSDAERLTFIRAIEERPKADWLPKLVYADWLEERGESELAEYIRELHRLYLLGAMTRRGATS